MIPILQQNTGGEDNNGDPLDEWGHHAEVPEVDDYEEGDGNSSANDLRELANTHYANNDFETALTLYTAALEAFEHERVTDNENEDSSSCNDQYIDLKVIYLCNRATCLFKLEMYEESRTDAVEAVNISNGEFQK
jgi:tetratricopeptide (TPR) repeat protein